MTRRNSAKGKRQLRPHERPRPKPCGIFFITFWHAIPFAVLLAKEPRSPPPVFDSQLRASQSWQALNKTRPAALLKAQWLLERHSISLSGVAWQAWVFTSPATILHQFTFKSSR